MSELTASPTAGSNGIGNLATLGDDQVLLPRFVLERPDGLYVDLSMLDSGHEFTQFVDRTFASGNVFTDLDYPIFLKLLFEPESEVLLGDATGSQERPEIRFANKIAPFPKERRVIYRDVRIDEDGARAEYIFEPVYLDVEEQIPVYAQGESQEASNITSYETCTVAVKTWANPDEFIAAMWLKGLRFGLDMDAIRRAIVSDKSERVDIARSQPASISTDASIIEDTEIMQRSDVPALLPNGKMDLRHFKNRFPQVAAGAQLAQKIPRKLGHIGWNVQGTVLEPEIPQDFDINTLAGAGTKIERTEEGEFLIAAITGFLNIDAASSTISITEKIINKTGISMRTTGDLSLTGAEFEEHGEVQEKREVQGVHMDFMANVFGRIVSAGGRVVLHQNLTGGSIQNPAGTVVIEGKVSNAVIDARGGEVELETVENSLIIASQVRITRAVNCEILGESVEIIQAEGCGIAAYRVTMETSQSFRNKENVLAILMPDTSWWNTQLNDLEAEKTDLETQRESLAAEQAALTEPPQVSQFLAIQRKLKLGELTLTPSQMSNLDLLADRITPTLQQLARVGRSTKDVKLALAALEEQRITFENEKAEALAKCTCAINHVQGDTVVRSLAVPTQGFPLGNLAPKELRLRLRERGLPEEQLFADDSGQYNWPQNP